MNAQGLFIMLISVGTVLALTVYCMYRVLNLPPVEMDDITGPLGIDTQDTVDAD
ncbi:MAG: hypothetical protein IT424_06390 [Pirellulales bacterium]|nr:hypothetical protein [Pirellulales bacterium]